MSFKFSKNFVDSVEFSKDKSFKFLHKVRDLLDDEGLLDDDEHLTGFNLSFSQSGRGDFFVDVDLKVIKK